MVEDRSAVNLLSVFHGLLCLECVCNRQGPENIELLTNFALSTGICCARD